MRRSRGGEKSEGGEEGDDVDKAKVFFLSCHLERELLTKLQIYSQNLKFFGFCSGLQS